MPPKDGTVSLHFVQAAKTICAEHAQTGATAHGATLRELQAQVRRYQVGLQVARALVPKLVARGHLRIVGERRVPYRNRPVAEYAPVERPDDLDTVAPAEQLGACLKSWAR